MTKVYLKEKLNIVNSRRLGATGKLVYRTITFKNGKTIKSMPIDSIDKVYREIILCFNELLKENEFIKSISKIEYTNGNFINASVNTVNFDNLTINEEAIAKEQLVVNNTVKYTEIRTEHYMLSFEIFK